MTREIALNGLRITLGDPVQIIEGTGHLWFPRVERMPTGELLVTYILVADASNHVDAYGISVSKDEGQTWLPRYDVPGYNGSCMTHIPQPDGSLGGPSFQSYPDPPDQARTLRGTFELFQAGGARYTFEPRGMSVEGLLKDVDIRNPKGTAWTRNPLAEFYFYGDAVPIDDGYITSAYMKYAGDETYTLVVLRTEDLGRAWHYLSTVGDIHGLAPGAREGPCEPSLVALENGDLMHVMRVGGGKDQYLARAYSSDGGKTWSKMDRLPAWSVAPSLWRTNNGVIALSTGRPGIYLWLADDPMATNWQSIDIQAHHNAAMGSEHQIRVEYGGDVPAQTTAYTEIMEVSPNRLWLTYDRTPFGWNPTPPDSDERNRIYILPIEVERL